jgi:hypothetical protein
MKIVRRIAQKLLSSGRELMRRSNLFLYLILNIIVSAATTLGVLAVWERARKADIPPPPAALATLQISGSSAAAAGIEPAATVDQAELQIPPTPLPTETELPPDLQVIEIFSVVAPGDLDQEVVLLRRVGEGNLRMTGWRLEGENGEVYVFPEQPELVLYKDGAVQLYTTTGENTATEVYWNRDRPAWQSGEVVRLLDAAGNERAVYRVP